MIDVSKCREALHKLISGDYSLHIPPQKDDVDFLLSDALDELERLQQQS